MCPKLSEKTKEACKSFTLNVKLGVIKRFDHGEQNKDIVCALSAGPGNIKKRPAYMKIASLLYIILAFEKFHRNVLLSDSGGNPYSLVFKANAFDLE